MPDEDVSRNTRSWLAGIARTMAITRDMSLAAFSILLMLIIELIPRRSEP